MSPFPQGGTQGRMDACGEAARVSPLPQGGTYAPSPALGGRGPPPFPPSLGSNLGVRAPSLYKPCRGWGGVGGGGARGWRWQRRAVRERFILYMNDF